VATTAPDEFTFDLSREQRDRLLAELAELEPEYAQH
jgi:hypothetical protein